MTAIDAVKRQCDAMQKWESLMDVDDRLYFSPRSGRALKLAINEIQNIGLGSDDAKTKEDCIAALAAICAEFSPKEKR